MMGIDTAKSYLLEREWKCETVGVKKEKKSGSEDKKEGERPKKA